MFFNIIKIKNYLKLCILIFIPIIFSQCEKEDRKREFVASIIDVKVPDLSVQGDSIIVEITYLQKIECALDQRLTLENISKKEKIITIFETFDFESICDQKAEIKKMGIKIAMNDTGKVFLKFRNTLQTKGSQIGFIRDSVIVNKKQ